MVPDLLQAGMYHKAHCDTVAEGQSYCQTKDDRPAGKCVVGAQGSHMVTHDKELCENL